MSARSRAERADEVPASEVRVFRATLWEWDGPAAWHFVSVPEDLADDIEQEFGAHAGGFGSIRVEVTIGSDTWRTSLFPDNKAATYLLPVKKDVRRRQSLEAGAPTTVAITVLRPHRAGD